jgi:hypothetical protein
MPIGSTKLNNMGNPRLITEAGENVPEKNHKKRNQNK